MTESRIFRSTLQAKNYNICLLTSPTCIRGHTKPGKEGSKGILWTATPFQKVIPKNPTWRCLPVGNVCFSGCYNPPPPPANTDATIYTYVQSGQAMVSAPSVIQQRSTQGRNNTVLFSNSPHVVRAVQGRGKHCKTDEKKNK